MQANLDCKKLSRVEQKLIKGGTDPYAICYEPGCYLPDGAGGCGTCDDYRALPDRCKNVVLVHSDCQSGGEFL